MGWRENEIVWDLHKSLLGMVYQSDAFNMQDLAIVTFDRTEHGRDQSYEYLCAVVACLNDVSRTKLTGQFLDGSEPNCINVEVLFGIK